MRIAIVVAAALVLAGCGSNSNDEAESSAAPSSEASATSTAAPPPALTDEQRQQREQQFLYGLEQVGMQVDAQVATTAGWRTCELMMAGKGFIEVATTVVDESQGRLGIDQAGAIGGVAIRWLCPENEVVFR